MSIAVNRTGRPERVIGPGGINVNLMIASSGHSDFDRFMISWLKKYVQVAGGGSAQAAFAP